MKRRNIRHGLLALPALTALGAGYLVPLGIAFYKSFFAGMSANFAGLENYTDLFGNYAFGLAVRNLLRLWCIAVPLNLVFGVLLALPLAGAPLDALWAAVTSPAYLQSYRNTLALAVGGVVLQTAAALPAGYVLARGVSRRTRRICLALCGLLMLLPQQALMLPQYLILQQLGLLDTLAGLLLVTAFQPWMVLLFWFGASRLDGELFDAAACDGAAGATFARRLAWAARICSSRPRARSIGW